MIKGSICEKCYAMNYIKLRPGLDKCLTENTRVLTERVIPEEELPVLDDEIFRFESFSDLNNETQLTNYLNIARKNPGTRFTLWTKMYKLAYEYFKKTKDIPGNFTLILSSLMVNMRMPLSKFKTLKNGAGEALFAPGQLKVFTVYDKTYLESHLGEVDLNCGSRSCNTCRKCYAKNNVEEINEILKSDQSQVLVMEALEDPNKRAETADNLAALGTVFESI